MKKDLIKNKYIYLMLLPVIIYYLVFNYVPIFGNVIAFQRYSPGLGIMESPFVGFDNFVSFFRSIYFFRTLRNTILLSVYSIVFTFPAPIIFALLMNEIKGKHFKKVIQTVSYMPHFISMIVICGMIIAFTRTDGIISDLLAVFGVERTNLLSNKYYFRTIYIVSEIWQSVGWASIIYLATISGIDPTLYEAAVIDGAGRLKQALYVTLPCLVPLIAVQLIMKIGHLLSIGHEKVLLLYNPLTYETADIISTYIYRRGVLDSDFSFGSAVGLFNSAASLILLVFANWFSNTFVKEGLW